MSAESHCFKKRFGQNFLQDQAVIAQITHAISPKSNDHLVEIGPGQGALTETLIERCQHYSAIELDRDLIAPLTQQFSRYPHFQLHHADALNFALCQYSRIIVEATRLRSSYFILVIPLINRELAHRRAGG